MNKKKLSIKDIVIAGMFTAIIAVLSIISIPTPFGIPVTLQTFAIALCGYVLGWKLGLFSTVIYILVGAIGLPIFAGFSSGFGALFGMTGGFIWGFLFLAVLCGLQANSGNKVVSITLGLLGLIICHILGIVQFSLVTSTSLLKSFFIVSSSFLIKDIISIAGAYFVSIAINRAISKLGYNHNV